MWSDLGERLTGHSGIHELMQDLGHALEEGRDLVMMGGGHPASIPEVEAVIRERMTTLMNSDRAIERMIGDYDAPIGSRRFREIIADFFRRNAGFDIGPDHVAITSGSQPAFFLLFNMLGGMSNGRMRRILLPLAPEYIGYADQGLEPGLFTSCRALIELHGERRFKYHIDFDAVARVSDVAAICFSRPTNPSSNCVGDNEVARFVREADERDCPLMIDNAYGMPFPGAVYRDITIEWHPRMILSYSLSKLGMPGTRTGIVIADPAIIHRLEVANSVLMLSNGNTGPVVAGELFRTDAIMDLARRVIRPYYEKQNRFAAELMHSLMPEDIPWRLHESEGAFFLWLWLPDLPGGNRVLYRRLKDAGLLIVPGHWFFTGLSEPWQHADECIRISYCVGSERIQRGIEILAGVIREVYGSAAIA
jgi:valine--pyruvate aminotransferase